MRASNTQEENKKLHLKEKLATFLSSDRADIAAQENEYRRIFSEDEKRVTSWADMMKAVAELKKNERGMHYFDPVTTPTVNYQPM